MYSATGDERVNVSQERLESLQWNAESFVLIAELDGELVGTVQLTLCPDVMIGFQSYGIVGNIVVAENVRRKGVGRSLMCEIERRCNAGSCSKDS